MVLKGAPPEGSPTCDRYAPHVNFEPWAEVLFSSPFGDADVRKNAFRPPSRPQGGCIPGTRYKSCFSGGDHVFGHFLAILGILAETVIRYRYSTEGILQNGAHTFGGDRRGHAEALFWSIRHGTYKMRSPQTQRCVHRFGRRLAFRRIHVA